MILKNFSKTFFVWSEWTILGREMAHPNDSGSAARIFEIFAQRKGPIGR